MKEIDLNKEAWGKLSSEHYEHFKKLLQSGEYKLNSYIEKELSNISAKEIIHLQCNTGADTILLSKMCKNIVGVDLVPDNILYAKKLADDLNINNIDFFECDIMQLNKKHNKKYDLVFTSEGAVGWLPDLTVWAKTIRQLLKDDGLFYMFDSHPFYLCFDDTKLDKEIYEIMYPYFSKEPDESNSIGGYASERKDGVKAYFWMYTISDIVNSLTREGLHIEFLNEYRENFFDSGNMKFIKEKRMYNYEYNKNKYPMSMSLMASVYKK